MKQDLQEKRIESILGNDEEIDFDEARNIFYQHLKENLDLPCEVTGIEDFGWEEFYVFGPGSKKEYERLKNLLVSERNAEENDYVRSFQRTYEGSINIDFVKLFRENDLTNDVVLQDRDVIYIPVKRKYINVMGGSLYRGI